MASSTDPRHPQRYQTLEEARSVFEKCLGQRQPVQVTFRSRRTDGLIVRHVLPVRPAPELAERNELLLHFVDKHAESGSEHPLALAPERIVRIEPAGHEGACADDAGDQR